MKKLDLTSKRQNRTPSEPHTLRYFKYQERGRPKWFPHAIEVEKVDTTLGDMRGRRYRVKEITRQEYEGLVRK